MPTAAAGSDLVPGIDETLTFHPLRIAILTISDSRDEQTGKRSPEQEDDCRGNRDRKGWEQHRAPAVPVGDVPGEQEAHVGPRRDECVDDRESER